MGESLQNQMIFDTTDSTVLLYFKVMPGLMYFDGNVQVKSIQYFIAEMALHSVQYTQKGVL